jgi:hypothetical protein
VLPRNAQLDTCFPRANICTGRSLLQPSSVETSVQFLSPADFELSSMQKGDVRPDPGQYEGMHAQVRFPAHERGTLFDAPPVEPLLAPPARSLSNIVSTFMSTPQVVAAPRCSPLKHHPPKPPAHSARHKNSRTQRGSGRRIVDASF